jgi:hypothetical protein
MLINVAASGDPAVNLAVKWPGLVLGARVNRSDPLGRMDLRRA